MKRIYSLSGLVALGVLMAGGCDIQTRAEPHPICVVKGFDIEGLESPRCISAETAETLLDLPVLAGGGGRQLKLKLASPDKVDEEEEVKTCRDYLKRSGRGWFALSSRDMAVEGYFVRNCKLLRHLTEAQASEQSHIQDVDGLMERLELLPASLLAPMEFGPKERRLALGGTPEDDRNLQALIRDGDATIIASNERSLRLEHGGTEGTFEEIARGDFNGDGLEDAFIFMNASQKDGSARWFRSLLLERKEPLGPLTVKTLRD